MPGAIGRLWRLPLRALGLDPGEARELADLLQETLPDLHVDRSHEHELVTRATPSQLRGPSYKDRLHKGTPIPISDIDWRQLQGVVSTESLKEEDTGAGQHGTQVEVNSGGRVFFCLLAPSRPGEPEGVCVLKFGPSRLLMQAEQFANELTRHLDICAPECRIVRQAGATSDEWRTLTEVCARLAGQPAPAAHLERCDTAGNDAPEGLGPQHTAASGGGGGGSAHGAGAGAAGGMGSSSSSSSLSGGFGGHSGAAELLAELTALPVVLLMEYCPGASLLECADAFQSPGPLLNTLEGLGRLFLLDLVLGNADRLPCSDLGWRGNPNNILFGRPGSRCSLLLVAIDSCVQRRPPAARLSAEDAGVDRLAQLLLTDTDVTLDLLRRSILGRSHPGLAALAGQPLECAEAFQRGFRSCLGHVERIKGLLEMMHSKMHDWSMEFISDIKTMKPELPIPTPAVTNGPTAAAPGVIQARYTGLNIRVTPSSGGGGAGGGAPGGGRAARPARNAARTAGSTGSGVNSLSGSPARPGRTSPYLTTARSANRPQPTPPPHGPTGGNSLLAAPSSVARRRSSLSGPGAAAAAAAAIAAVGSPPQASTPSRLGPGCNSSPLPSGASPPSAGSSGAQGSTSSSPAPGPLGASPSSNASTPVGPAAAAAPADLHSPPLSVSSGGSVTSRGMRPGGGGGGGSLLARRAAAGAAAAAAAAAAEDRGRHRSGSLSRQGSGPVQGQGQGLSRSSSSARLDGGGSGSGGSGAGGVRKRRNSCRAGGGGGGGSGYPYMDAAAAAAAMPGWALQSPYMASLHHSHQPNHPQHHGSSAHHNGSSLSGSVNGGLSVMASRRRSSSSGTALHLPTLEPSKAAAAGGGSGGHRASTPTLPPANTHASGGRVSGSGTSSSAGSSILSPSGQQSGKSTTPCAPRLPTPNASLFPSPSHPPSLPAFHGSPPYEGEVALPYRRASLAGAPATNGLQPTLTPPPADPIAGTDSPPLPSPFAPAPPSQAHPNSHLHTYPGRRNVPRAAGRTSTSSSPSRNPPAIRARTIANHRGNQPAEPPHAPSPPAASQPLLRTCRSYGTLRSPRRIAAARWEAGSPRRNVSPASPKFRSPIVQSDYFATDTDGLVTHGSIDVPGAGVEASTIPACCGASVHDPVVNISLDWSLARPYGSLPYKYGSGEAPPLPSHHAGPQGRAAPGLHGALGAQVHRLSHLHPASSSPSGLAVLSGPAGADGILGAHGEPGKLQSHPSNGPGTSPGAMAAAAAAEAAAAASGNGTKPPLPRSGSGRSPATSPTSPNSAHPAGTPTATPTTTTTIAGSPQDTPIRVPTATSSPSSGSPFSFHTVPQLDSPRSVTLTPDAASPSHSPTPTAPTTTATRDPPNPTNSARAAATPSPHTPAMSQIRGPGTTPPPSSTSSSSRPSAGPPARRPSPSTASSRGAAGRGHGPTPGSGSGPGRGTGGRGVRGASPLIVRASPNHASPYEQLKSDLSLTMALKSISNEARKDDHLSSRVQHWKELFRTRGEELKAAVGEWQSRHALERVLTTGFLDGTHPIVDTYELKVRLEHMLRRLQVLQEAAAAQKPSLVLAPPGGLFLGGAVSADSHHILRHLGVTHIVNATEELLLPPPSTGFVVLRVALRDVDDEDIAAHFEAVSEFVQSCHAAGGSVLVHCSEGKSRSVTLVLAYLMRVKGWRLQAAFDHVKSRRPVACPNAGFMARLLSYERQLYGSNSYVPPQQLKKAKPEPVTCPVCGLAVGISSASLAVHMKRAHPPPDGPAAAAAAAVGAGGGSGRSHGGGGGGYAGAGGGVVRASGGSRKALLQAHGGGGGGAGGVGSGNARGSKEGGHGRVGGEGEEGAGVGVGGSEGQGAASAGVGA